MKRFLILLLLMAFSCQLNSKRENVLYINGRIEGDDFIASNKYAGRVVKLLHDEGDDVRKGELLAVLDSKEVLARFKQAEANYRASLSSLRAKEREVEFYRNRLNSLRLKLSQLRQTVNSGIKIAEENLSLSEKNWKISAYQLEKARSTFERVEKDYKRYRKLYEKRVISESKFDSVKNSFEVAKENFRSAKENLKKASRAVKIAKQKLLIALARKKEIESLESEIKALSSTVKAKEKEVRAFEDKANAAKALLQEAKAVLDEMKVCSPTNGTITRKNAEIGEVIPAGFRLFIIYNLDKLYFEGYIPETKLGLVRIGQRGYVKVDSYPNRKFPVKVTFISSKAEFTPKEVQTKEERVKQVFKVKMRLIENPGHVLKPGMPADCYLEIKE